MRCTALDEAVEVRRADTLVDVQPVRIGGDGGHLRAGPAVDVGGDGGGRSVGAVDDKVHTVEASGLRR